MMVPEKSAGFLRFCLRSKWRTGALLGTLWSGHDVLRKLGFWMVLKSYFDYLRDMYQATIDTWTEASETFSAMRERVIEAYEFVEIFITPWKLVLYLVLMRNCGGAIILFSTASNVLLHGHLGPDFQLANAINPPATNRGRGWQRDVKGARNEELVRKI